MTDTSFARKKLELTITLGEGPYGENVGSSVTLSGLRMTADIAKAGGDSMGEAHLRIFGLTESRMNQLTTIGFVAREIRMKNTVSLLAGDDVNGMRLIFQGTIDQSWADYSAMPQVALNVIAYAGMDAAIRPVAPITFNSDSTDVSGIMAGLAKTMGYAFRDCGVSVKLSYPYFEGSALTQARSCARAADIWMTIDQNTLIIWPKRDAGVIGDIPLISSASGMQGYPSFSSKGLTCVTLFNPDIQLPGKVLIQSSLQGANGTFNVFNITHSLSSEMPNGPWQTIVECYPDE